MENRINFNPKYSWEDLAIGDLRSPLPNAPTPNLVEVLEAEPINITSTIKDAPEKKDFEDKSKSELDKVPTPLIRRSPVSPKEEARTVTPQSPITPKAPSTVSSGVGDGEGGREGGLRLPEIERQQLSMPSSPNNIGLTPGSMSSTPVEDPVDIKLRDAEKHSTESNSNFDWKELMVGVVPSLMSLFTGTTSGYKLGGQAMMDRENTRFKTDEDIRKMLVKRAIAGDKAETVNSRPQKYWDEETQSNRMGSYVQDKTTGQWHLQKTPDDPTLFSESQNPDQQLRTQGIRLASKQMENLVLGKGWQKLQNDLGQDYFVHPGSQQRFSPEQMESLIRGYGAAGLDAVARGGQLPGMGGQAPQIGGQFSQTGTFGQARNAMTSREWDADKRITDGWDKIVSEADDVTNAGISGLNYISDPEFAWNSPATMQAVTQVVRQTEKGVLTDNDFYRYYQAYGFRGRLNELRNWWTQNTYRDPKTGAIRFNKGVLPDTQRHAFTQLLEAGTLQNLSNMEEKIYTNNLKGQGLNQTPEKLADLYNTKRARSQITNGKVPIKVVKMNGDKRETVRALFTTPDKLEAIREAVARQGHHLIEL